MCVPLSESESTGPRHRRAPKRGRLIASGIVLLAALAALVTVMLVSSNATTAAPTSHTSAAAPRPTGKAVLRHTESPTPATTPTPDAAIQPYVGTWYSPEAGITMVMSSNGHATVSWVAGTVGMTCKPFGSGLSCDIVSDKAPNTGFKVGGQVSLSATDGGIVFNPYAAADETELYQKSSTSSITPYVGTWYAHSTELVVNSDGTGELNYRDYNSCPMTTDFMCNIEEGIELSASGNTATITVVSSQAIIQNNDGSTASGPSDIPDGTTYTVTLLGNHEELKIDMGPTPYSNGTFKACKSGSEVDLSNDCGA